MTVLDRLPVEAINARAASLRPANAGKALLAVLLFLLASPFMLAGWTAKAVVYTVIWVWSAVLVGWDSGPSARVARDG